MGVNILLSSFVLCQLLLLQTTLAAETNVLPDFIPTCHRRDPEFVKCVLAAIEKVKPRLATGIPELNVPAIEPMILPKVSVDRDLEAIVIKAVLTKLKVAGPSSFKIKKLKIDLDNYSADVSVTIPKINIASDYDVSGRLLLIPLGGKGFMHGNFTDLSARARGSGKVVTRNGVQYLDIDKFGLKTRIGGGSVKFVAKDNTRLIAETAAAFFNGNPRLVLDIINPIVEDSTKDVLLDIVTKMFATIPLKELLPED